MDSRQTRERDKAADRERSRSPTRHSPAALATLPSNFRFRGRNVPDSVRADWVEALRKAGEVARERLLNTTAEERLKEAGPGFFLGIKSNPCLVVYLQRKPNYERNKPTCGSYESCLEWDGEDSDSREVHDTFRTAVDRHHGRRGKNYYHVDCFQTMFDATKLFPDKFKLYSKSETSGFMACKWFEQQGCVDLNKIVIYLDEEINYKNEKCECKNFAAELDWNKKHKETCQTDPDKACACPPMPERIPCPKLETSEEDKCSLSDLLDHPRVGEFCVNLCSHYTPSFESVCAP